MHDTIYCYPGTDVLINKLGIRDQDQLDAAERDLTAFRLISLRDHPIHGKFDYKHLKAIHKYIFQDIYSWAGKERKVDIAKGNMFCNVMFLPQQANRIFSELTNENYLEDLPKDKFIERLAYYFGEINALHPFREGNGRTQREFFRELSMHMGYVMDFSMISQEDMLEASKDSFMLQYDKLEKILRSTLINL